MRTHYPTTIALPFHPAFILCYFIVIYIFFVHILYQIKATMDGTAGC